MLNNLNAGNVLAIMRRFADAGISMNCQIVLCRGVNDGDELSRTIEDLAKLSPAVESVSVVPVGLTKYRDGLPKLIPFNKETASAVIAAVERCQVESLNSSGTRFVFLADEFYLLAKQLIPAFEEYEDFLQIENGVGMMAMFWNEFQNQLTIDNGQWTIMDKFCKKRKISQKKKTIITGVAAYEFISELVESLSPNTQVFAINNEFFGERITVAGLVTGQDIINQLRGKELGDEILIPKCMLRAGDTVFLDDITVEDIERELSVKVKTLTTNGGELKLNL